MSTYNGTDIVLKLRSTSPQEDLNWFQRALLMAVRSYATADSPRTEDRELLVHLADLSEALLPEDRD